MNKELIAASPERPIRSKEQDLLGRSAFVDRLCNALINPDTKQSTGVTIGVTGEWGSGKSSILNLLHERVEERYKNAIVIRFDPWLVSNRDDLIRQFFAEFVGTINKEPSIKKRMAKLTEKLVDYAAHLSPAADLYTPGLGAIVGGGLRTTKQIIRRDTSLHTQRIEMVETLDQLTTPIVVIIDELDRIEDDEVHAVAQLVRSVADFPPLSYILAYDVNRVIQALGSGMNKEERNRRGQDYLEKIIQFQIPLPVTLQGELYDLLRAELIEIKADTILSDSWETTERFKELIDIILVPGLISTPRDVKRLIGTYHVVGAMVRGEVEWVDLLAFCVLLVKAPWIIYRLRKEPDYAVENPLSNRILERRLDDQQSNTVERLGIFLPDVATLDEIGPIMRFLFPWFANQRADEHRHPDSLCYRRPLLTVLRWNLLPSTHSRSEIIEFLSLTRRDILEKLTALDTADKLGPFLDRLGDVYPEVSNLDHTEFWMAASDFLQKSDCEWLSAYSMMHEIARAIGDIFIGAVTRNGEFRVRAKEILEILLEKDDVTLTSYLIREQIFRNGLFGCASQSRDVPFLSESRTVALATERSALYKRAHLDGNWIASLWWLQPVYTMLDIGTWDEECRRRLDNLLTEDRARDGFTLMLFGAAFTTGRETLEKMMDVGKYIGRVKERLARPEIASVDPTVQFALRKAIKARTD